jgi:hypothetical protein
VTRQLALEEASDERVRRIHEAGAGLDQVLEVEPRVARERAVQARLRRQHQVVAAALQGQALGDDAQAALQEPAPQGRRARLRLQDDAAQAGGRTRQAGEDALHGPAAQAAQHQDVDPVLRAQDRQAVAVAQLQLGAPREVARVRARRRRELARDATREPRGISDPTAASRREGVAGGVPLRPPSMCSSLQWCRSPRRCCGRAG